MGVETVGFFRELPHGDPQGPSLREALGGGEDAFRDQIANYLVAGAVLATTTESVFDVLKGEEVSAGRLAIKTDGQWVWPADLSYYVREYNVKLPVEFVDRIRSLNWSAPDLSRDELIEIESRFFED
ncbi:hypothetical protein AB0H63_17970 [Micromonospora echinospora]|uniref:hypothetical protein n=1 Tax=Micromonospora echinospora TaxID=1877 RepID=UPI003403F766